ncbi:unnamed protein product, partial [Phaeothamnion confervicola]
SGGGGGGSEGDEDDETPEIPASETTLARELAKAGAKWIARGRPSKDKSMALRLTKTADCDQLKGAGGHHNIPKEGKSLVKLEDKERERATVAAAMNVRKDEERRLMQQTRRYPVPDEQHWEEQERHGRLPRPYPCADAASPLALPSSALSAAEAKA